MAALESLLDLLAHVFSFCSISLSNRFVPQDALVCPVTEFAPSSPPPPPGL